MLIIFSGLPGSGKTTTAQSLARAIGAVYLRVDTIEQTLREADDGRHEGPAGYMIAYRVAEDNLVLGATVIADCVNGLNLTRDAWMLVAAKTISPVAEIEIVCSDEKEHRRRVETRDTDVEGLIKPTWSETQTRVYEPRKRTPIMIDTAVQSTDEIVADLIERLGFTKKRAGLAKT
ncbi:AAA family ATPase [Oryzifoliimicrobium ureilyticus]|uniref:AAA family ATPase n=1 Tax=Oryzifoliimicrobium ureilyticus TaxID=3113724 RepID=UPI00307640B7